jgi:2-dehydropantoate 2-reductase
MRHAVVGVGGVGGLLASALGRSGVDVVALMREPTLSSYPGRFTVDSRVLGSFTVEVPAVSQLDREVDVVWVTAKSTGLEAALALAPPDRVNGATVIPLLNGVDHLAVLRSRYPAVVAGALRAETERVADGHIVQRSGFIRIDLVGSDVIAQDVRASGIDCRVVHDELTLLWQKLVFLAPFALATTAADAPLGAVRSSDLYRQAQVETVAVAQAEGANIDVDALQQLSAAASDEMRSSMQRDLEAQRALELDAIAGPVLRGGRAHHIQTSAVEELAARVAARVAAAGVSGGQDTS